MHIKLLVQIQWCAAIEFVFFCKYLPLYTNEVFLHPPGSDVNKDLTFKDKDKDQTPKDKDQTFKAKDQDKVNYNDGCIVA